MKTLMLTRLLIWAMVVAMPLWFSGCKKGNEDTVTPATSSASVEGNYKVTALKVDSKVKGI